MLTSDVIVLSVFNAGVQNLRLSGQLLLMPLLLGPIASVLSAVLLPSIENASLKTRERFLVVVSDTMS